MNYKEQVIIFRAFCDEKRLQILELLSEGEKCACILLEKLNTTQSGLSYHMKILVLSGVVESRQEGKWTHYKISKTGSEYAKKLITNITSLKDANKVGCCKKII